MKANTLKKLISGLLCLVMLIGSLPVTVFADDTAQQSETAFVSETHQVFSHKQSTIAPGITSSTNYAYATADGKQMVYYVATADINRDDVELHSSYKDAQCTNYGMEKLTNQMAAADTKYQQEKPYFKAVAGVNGDFYNMTTGQPSGAFVMDGVMSSNKANNRPWFAVFEDGTALCGANNSDWDAAVAAHGKAQEAVGGSQMLVVGGKDVTASASGSYNTDRHSRSMVGVTADNKVVICTLDGRQEPFSCGGTMHELAQIMLEQGCEIAINLDGGGSSTFVTRPEGENDIKVINRPSDGSERSISSGILIATTATPSNVFERATLTAENDYVTPKSTVVVSAKGVSPAGTAADIPEDAVWQLADASMGTIEDGVFVSNGTVGDAVVQMVYGGNVVGETTIHVVIPTTLSFSSEEITVPFGKTVELSMTATCNNGLNEVVLKAEDIDFTLENSAIGSINGFDFIAVDENTAADESNVTAKIVYDTNVTASSKIKLGKGSEVLFDFEDGLTNNFGLSWGKYNYYLPNSSMSFVDSETGKVHSGNKALALNIDYTNSLESGYQMIGMYFKGETLYRENAKQLGMWIYIPDECVSLWARWMNVDATGVDSAGNYTVGQLTGQTVDGTIDGKTGYVYSFEESGWHYLSIDISSAKGAVLRKGYYCMQFYISDRAGDASTGYLGLKDKDSGQYTNVNGNYTFYIDDITVDYSSAVDDREAPVFSELNYATTTMSDAVGIEKRDVPTIKYSNVDFAAKVTENTSKSNASGLDVSTAKAYVDGNEVGCTYSGGVISMNNTAVLSDGQHTIKFSICDMQGNYASIIRRVNIQAGTSAAIKVVAHDSKADRVLLGSVNYIDVVASEVEKVDSVSMKLDLDNMSKWQLEHMEVAEGFEATWSMANADAAENIATLNITRKSDIQETGEMILVSIPVRMWALDNPVTVGSTVWDYSAFKASKETWPISIDLTVDQGAVKFTDGTTDTFTGESVRIGSEMWGTYSYMTLTDEGKAYWNSWNGGHVHTAAPVADKAATCTESGYTGRTFCDVCNSVVDWGTDVSATGHKYELTDGKLACTGCGDLFNGTFTDGKTYVDGVVISDGWVGDSYYINGVMLTGVQEADGYYYDFGDNGVCDGKVKYTGIFEKDGNSYCSKMGVLTSGWQSIVADDGNSYFYYFDETDFTMYTGVRDVNGLTYTFDDSGKMTRGAFRTNDKGTKYFVAGESWFRRFVTLEEGTYWLNENGYVAYGNAYTVTTNVKDITWYHFDEETGLLTGLCNGIIEYNGEEYYCDENGKVFYGAIKLDDEIIFTATRGKIVKNDKCYISGSNMLKGCDLAQGLYWCDENGHVLSDGFAEIDGSTYYYNDYRLAKGFTKIGDAYYMFNASSGKMYTNMQLWVGSNAYGIKEGMYYFGADGVMMKTGINENDGEYYYVQSSGELIKDATIWVSQTNDLLESGEGYYAFDESGKLIKTGFVTGGGATYYYDNAVRVKGLTKIGDRYYMFNASSGKMYTDMQLWVGSNAYGVKEGMYYFGADGSTFIPDSVNGVKAVVEENGKLYFTVDGIKKTDGINELDGAYYYAKSNSELAAGVTVWVSQTNDLLESGEGYYAFDESGKLIKTGFVTGGGATYYYDNAVRVKGLTKIGDRYYMFNASSGKMYTDMQLWVGNNAYGVKEGMYYFGADGSTFIPDSVNGVKAVVEENGKLYFTIDGVKVNNGINELDGAYYYAKSNSELAAGVTVWVSQTNDLLESGEGYYAFDESGKLIKTGFVTGGGATYYYDNAVRAKGFTKIGDQYYMLNASSGKMYTDMQLWVGSNTYGIREGMYYFGTDGVMVQK